MIPFLSALLNKRPQLLKTETVRLHDVIACFVASAIKHVVILHPQQCGDHAGPVAAALANCPASTRNSGAGETTGAGLGGDATFKGVFQ